MKTDNKLNQIEYSKMPGFDVLEKLPQEKLQDTYNEQFYSTLSGMKFLSMTIPDDNKLFYHFEQNQNASVSATTEQVLKTYKDLYIENEDTKRILSGIKDNIVTIFKEYENIDVIIDDELKPEIEKMEKKLQNFLVEQKTENFKLIKEIAILEKEKAEIQRQIEEALARLEKLEKEVGMKQENANTFIEGNPSVMGVGDVSNNTEKFTVEKATSIK